MLETELFPEIITSSIVGIITNALRYAGYKSGRRAVHAYISLASNAECVCSNPGQIFLD
jgi:hypothetical protein